MTLSFGTDGVRGDARSELTADAVETLGRAAVEVLEAEKFAVGRDTRISGPIFVEGPLPGCAARRRVGSRPGRGSHAGVGPLVR